MRKAAFGGLLLLLLLGAGTFCTVGRRSHFDCIDCGLYFQDRTLLGIRFPKYERRQRTDWYDRRIGTVHDHLGSKSKCTAGLNLWNKPTLFWCGRTEALVGADEWLSQVLLRLEPLGLDLPYHRELTQPDKEHRNAAVASAEKFGPTWKDTAVYGWWEKAGWSWPARR